MKIYFVFIILLLIVCISGVLLAAENEGINYEISSDRQGNIIIQKGINELTPFFLQSGYNNFIFQFWGGINNFVRITQKGNLNFAYLDQRGDSNQARISQEGNNNTAVIKQKSVNRD